MLSKDNFYNMIYRELDKPKNFEAKHYNTR